MGLKNNPELTGEECYNEVMTWDAGYHEVNVYELQKLYAGHKWQGQTDSNLNYRLYGYTILFAIQHPEDIFYLIELDKTVGLSLDDDAY